MMDNVLYFGSRQGICAAIEELRELELGHGIVRYMSSVSLGPITKVLASLLDQPWVAHETWYLKRRSW